MKGYISDHFQNLSKLVTLSVFENSELDMDLQVLGSMPMLEHAMAQVCLFANQICSHRVMYVLQECSIRGTMPTLGLRLQTVLLVDSSLIWPLSYTEDCMDAAAP